MRCDAMRSDPILRPLMSRYSTLFYSLFLVRSQNDLFLSSSPPISAPRSKPNLSFFPISRPTIIVSWLIAHGLYDAISG